MKTGSTAFTSSQRTAKCCQTPIFFGFGIEYQYAFRIHLQPTSCTYGCENRQCVCDLCVTHAWTLGAMLARAGFLSSVCQLSASTYLDWLTGSYLPLLVKEAASLSANKTKILVLFFASFFSAKKCSFSESHTQRDGYVQHTAFSADGQCFLKPSIQTSLKACSLLWS